MIIYPKSVFKFSILLAISAILPFGPKVEAQSLQNSKKLLNSLTIAIQKNHDRKMDLIDALSENGFIVLPSAREIGTDKTKLPAPPDLALDKQIDELLVGFPEISPSLTLLTFPAIRIGGLYTIEGSGDCYNWEIFDYDSKLSHELPTPSIFLPDVCSKDGSQSYLALINHQLVALDIDLIPLEPDQGRPPTRIGLRLTLQSWTGKDWDEPAILKLGYK